MGLDMTKGRAVEPFTPEFKPGDYGVWHPEISPAGPSRDHHRSAFGNRKRMLYRNGKSASVARPSATGTKGHPTPTGMFTILQKKVRHELLSIYKARKDASTCSA